MYRDVKFHPKNTNIQESSFLITGGAGFIGSHIVEYLMQHEAGKVHVLDNLSEGRIDNIRPWLENPRFRFFEGDICDVTQVEKALEGIDFVSHQAALGSVPRSILNPLATNQANVTGFLTVLDCARKSGVKSFVYASSSSVYGDHPVLPKKEENIGNPLSPYAVSKRVDELYADVFSRSYGMRIIGLRYFNIFGPRQNPDGPYAAVIPLFIDALLKDGKAFMNGDGMQTRDFTYIENAVQANIKAMYATSDGAFGKVYNVAVGERVSVKEMFYMLREDAGSQLEPLFRESRDGDIRDSLADISMAQKYLGYNPQVRMREGLRRTLDSSRFGFS